MQSLNVIGLIVAVAIVALVGIAAIVVAIPAASLSVQSASHGDTTTLPIANMTPQGIIASGSGNNNNSNSNVTLGNRLAVTQGINETYNAINETYAVVSYLDNVTLMPPYGTTIINATESGNSTVNILPNGITLVQGHGLLVTQEDGDGTEEENATTSFVSLGSTNPNGTGSRIGVVGTGSRIGVVFYNTNSTGQLAFLDNMMGVYKAESSQERVTSRMWEWKGGGGTVPFETGRSAPNTRNQTAIINSAPEEEEQTISTMTNNTTSNDVSNTLLSNRLLSFGEGQRTSFNPINDTYTEISVVSNTTIMPPNDTTTINVTEKGNVTFNIQPNGVTLAQGQVFLVTRDDDGTAQKENATATIVEINRIGPDGIGSATGVVFYNTNSTGQLAFLDNMMGVYQREITPEGSTIRTWEWIGGGGMLPFENSSSGSDAGAAAANQTTTTTSALQEE